jgi:glucokinase
MIQVSFLQRQCISGSYVVYEIAAIREVFMIAGPGDSILVFDVGGSHVSAAVCQRGDYRIGPVVSAPYPVEQSSQAQTSKAFVDLLSRIGLEASAGFNGIGGAELAFPGPFDLEAGVSLMKHKLPYLYGIELRPELASRFGCQPEKVRFLNDANAFLLGEIGGGAARGVRRAVGITLGTGIGSAFAVDGDLVTEGAGVPPDGEIWNLPFRDSTVEELVSSKAIRRYYEERTGKTREVVELAAAATDDPAASSAFVVFGQRLGEALRQTLVGFAPEVVVLGGGICRSAHLFLPAAQQELKDLKLHLLVSKLLDQAPLVGAGVAWFRQSNGSHPLAAASATHTVAE